MIAENGTMLAQANASRRRILYADLDLHRLQHKDGG